MLLETFQGDSRELQGYLKEVQILFHGSFKEDVLRKFHGCLKKYQVCIKKISRKVSSKFCFVILLLHESHRSFPSRGRACFLFISKDFLS